MGKVVKCVLNAIAVASTIKLLKHFSSRQLFISGK